MVSFASAEDFEDNLGSFMSINSTFSSPTQDFLDGSSGKLAIDQKETRKFIARLLRMGWEYMVKARRIPMYELAGGVSCLYFIKGLVENDKITFTSVDGKKSHRSVLGYRTRSQSGSKRYWHFGIQSKPLLYPFSAYIIKPHVLFSNDGNNIWESKAKLHVARRSQCRNWWNPDWRDKILATMNWLSDDAGKIKIQLGKNVAIQVLNQPIIFSSPVSYADPEYEQPLFDVFEDEVDELLDEVSLEDE